MRERLLIVLASFIALCTFASFALGAVFVFGISCAIIAAGLALRRTVIGLIGLFVLCVHAPFALEYGSISDESTLLAATVFVTFAIVALVHVTVTSDEKRRFDWRVYGPGLVVICAAALLVVHTVVLLARIGTIGAFLGDVETTGAQIVVLASATAIILALLLIPPADVVESMPA